jgi:hypothetical protein
VGKTDIIAESIKLCGYIGLPLSQFWQLTPYQFYQYVRGYNENKINTHDANVVFMYNNAALSQMGKKMPPLDKFLINGKKPQKIELWGVLEKHSKKQGVKDVSSS